MRAAKIFSSFVTGFSEFGKWDGFEGISEEVWRGERRRMR
jgi:hypothetical protein